MGAWKMAFIRTMFQARLVSENYWQALLLSEMLPSSFLISTPSSRKTVSNHSSFTIGGVYLRSIIANINYYKCDVSKWEEVEAVSEKIIEDVCQTCHSHPHMLTGPCMHSLGRTSYHTREQCRRCSGQVACRPDS